jgi:hypothetical protein
MNYSALAAKPTMTDTKLSAHEVKPSVMKVEIIHGGGKASDSMHVLIHGGFIVEVEPKTKWSAAVVKLAMAEMKSSAIDKLHPPCNKPNEIVPR